jgi:hypothetical protein
MANVHLKLPLQNEKSVELMICLEPICEYFVIQPSQQVEVHAIFEENTDNVAFTVAPND